VTLTADDIAVFDLGGVVARYYPDRRLHRLAHLTGLDEHDLSSRLFGYGLDHDAELGVYESADIVGVVLDALDGRLSEGALVEAWASAFEPDPAVLEFMHAMPGRVFILTNNGPMLNHCINGPLQVLRESVSEIICSWEVRARKPSREAFERAARRIGEDPARLVLFDDDMRNVDAARACGWRAEHVTGSACAWQR
jgi:HAD superfamily hydrolase (TIGR01509 family)